MDAKLLVTAVIVAVIVAGAFAVMGRSGAGVVTVTTTLQGSPATVTETVAETVTVTETRTTASTVTTTFEKTVAVEKIVLVDALGRRVELEKPAERVVSLAPSITDTLCMMGLCDRIVGADSISKNVDGVPASAVDVGSYWGPSAEKIIEAKPDLVLACRGVPAQERLARQLEAGGLKVFFLYCDAARNWADIEWDVNSIGLLLGARDAAANVTGWMEDVLAGLRERLVNVTRVNVSLIVYFDPKGLWVAGGGTFQDTMINTAGGVNVFGSRHGWGMVSFEDVIAANPDYVVVTTMGDKGSAEKLIDMAAGSPLSETRAWRSGHFCVIYGDAVNLVNRPEPRAVLGAVLLASILHGDVVEPPAGVEGFICNTG